MFGQITYIREEPPEFVSRFLIESERVLYASRLHWLTIFPHVASAIAATIGAIVVTFVLPKSILILANLFWVAVLVVWGWMLFKVWDWSNDWFMATDKRVLRVTGFFNRKTPTMPIGKVTDMEYHRSPFGELFGYGKFIFESAGQDQGLNKIDMVPHDRELYDALCTQLFGGDEKHRESVKEPRWRRRMKNMFRFLGSSLHLDGGSNKNRDDLVEYQEEHPDVPSVSQTTPLQRTPTRSPGATPQASAPATPDHGIPMVAPRNPLDGVAERLGEDHEIPWQETNQHSFTDFTNTHPRYPEAPAHGTYGVDISDPDEYAAAAANRRSPINTEPGDFDSLRDHPTPGVRSRMALNIPDPDDSPDQASPAADGASDRAARTHRKLSKPAARSKRRPLKPLD